MNAFIDRKERKRETQREREMQYLSNKRFDLKSTEITFFFKHQKLYIMMSSNKTILEGRERERGREFLK